MQKQLQKAFVARNFAPKPPGVLATSYLRCIYTFQAWMKINWYRLRTSHAIFTCLALGVW